MNSRPPTSASTTISAPSSNRTPTAATPAAPPAYRTCAGKIDRLRQWLSQAGHPEQLLREASFYTDSINDLALLSAVKRPIVVDPDPRLESTAHRKGWTVLRLNRQLVTGQRAG